MGADQIRCAWEGSVHRCFDPSQTAEWLVAVERASGERTGCMAALVELVDCAKGWRDVPFGEGMTRERR